MTYNQYVRGPRPPGPSAEAPVLQDNLVGILVNFFLETVDQKLKADAPSYYLDALLDLRKRGFPELRPHDLSKAYWVIAQNASEHLFPVQVLFKLLGIYFSSLI